jgi:myosin heavy subunit
LVTPPLDYASQAEIDSYAAEDIPLPPLEYRDNQDVLDLILARPLGLIPMLDEEGLVPGGSWGGFADKFGTAHGAHARVRRPPKSRRDELGIEHYAGVVFYDPSLFLVKNKDALSPDLTDAMGSSTVPLLRLLFGDSPKAASTEGGASNGGRASNTPNTPNTSNAKATVGKKFTAQLGQLTAALNATQPRYIRCVKPNQAKKPNLFAPGVCFEQLNYSGVFEAVIIMQNGYPFRLAHAQFRATYHMLVAGADRQAVFGPATGKVKGAKGQMGQVKERGFTREQCRAMVQSMQSVRAGLEDDEDGLRCFVGRTRTFYKVHQVRLVCG